ncbi:hypothetical protein SNE40_020142 [Patella caerulea]|uniref:Uncharacterized protein n=1 Tax=Patella caerulea TaxID=87958 RepID=A0AAN8GDG9_PATCE
MKVNTLTSLGLLQITLTLLAVVSTEKRLRATTLNCVQCSSMSDPSCDYNYIKEPTPCAPTDHYCSMFVVLVQGDRAVVKRCNSDAYTGCVIRQVGSVNATVCYETCDFDGCNNSNLMNRIF